jgi:hypothetical protein
MLKKTLVAVCVAAIALAVACGKSPNPMAPNAAVDGAASAAADGSTLKIAQPTPVAPINNFVFPAGQGTVTFSWNNVNGTFASFPVTYELEIKNANGTVVASPKVAASNGVTTSVAVTTLVADTIHTWRVRATYNGLVGPWSTGATFRTAIQAFINFATSSVFDPLVIGSTVGVRHGGIFTKQGWQALEYSDGIDYDLKACPSCRMEFDITNVVNGLDQDEAGDWKFFSMGDGSVFNNFGAFRDAWYKMHLEQRGDGDGTGMKLIWRILNDDDDHMTKFTTGGPDWDPNKVYHFLVQWTPNSYLITINNDVWFSGSLQGPYVPPNFRITLGCYPRSETMKDAIWSNIKINPI